MSDKKGKFIKGHNVLKGKTSGSKQLSKAKELERRKAEELETAAVLNEYVAEHQVRAVGKAFVRAGIEVPEIKPENKMFLPGNIETEVSDKLYKPKSRMQQLAEEFQKSKAVTEDFKASKDIKKKGAEKKKSNLELFKEELEKQQQERDIRRKIKKGDLSGISEETLNALPSTFFKQKTGGDDFTYQYNSGSKDTGDGMTTNLFVSNLNPIMNEEQLCKVFGKYGPLASVKIMWPRTEEEKQKNRNCGFVAYMNRLDGERALADIEGKDVMDYEMKIGWGKSVPIPPLPVYIHPSQSNVMKPPKQSGFPFNCQMPYKLRKQGIQFDGNLENTIVKVVMPTERTILSLINRVVEFVVREGPMFEAMIMNREIQNPLFRFLFDNKSNEHIYYRWRVFSLLQGDNVNKWQTGCFRMFVSGSLWQPPSMNPFHQPIANSGMTASAVLASNSAANVHSTADASTSLAMKKNFLLEHLLKEGPTKDDKEEIKKILSDRQRDRLEDMLRTITTDRTKIGELMRWSVDHSEYAEEIVECVCESLSILETPIPTKVARLYVVNDILHNTGTKIQNVSNFRKHFQNNLLETMEHLHKALSTCSTKLQQEKFRKQVLSCLAAWQDWSLYPPGFLINLQNVFVGISTSHDIKVEEEKANNDSLKAKLDVTSDIDGNPIDDDIDGVALGDDDLDGIAMESNDIDGIPLSKDINEGNDIYSKWEKDKTDSNMLTSENDTNDPLSNSKWQRVDEETTTEETNNKFKAAKWEKVEGLKEGKSSDVIEEKSKKSTKSRSVSRSPQREDESDRRKFLRDVEVKVMRFVDKLEQKGASRSGLNIQQEAGKFRQQLINEFDNARSRENRRKSKSSKVKRERSLSPSSNESKRRKSARKRNRSSSGSDFDNYKTNRSNNTTGASPNSFSPRRSTSPPYRRSRSPANHRSPIFSDRSRSPYGSRSSPPRRDRRSRSRSFSCSPVRRRRSISPRSPIYSRMDRSPSPPSYSPRHSSQAKSAKKKKAKKSKK